MARKTKRTYQSMTIHVTSATPVSNGKLKGILTAKVNDAKSKESGKKSAEDIDEMSFDEVADDKTMLIVGERKWIPIKLNKQYGIRVTKNKETGEYRILCTLTKEKLQSMTLRDVGELEAELGLMIEKIRL